MQTLFQTPEDHLIPDEHSIFSIATLKHSNVSLTMSDDNLNFLRGLLENATISRDEVDRIMQLYQQHLTNAGGHGRPVENPPVDPPADGQDPLPVETIPEQNPFVGNILVNGVRNRDDGTMDSLSYSNDTTSTLSTEKSSQSRLHGLANHIDTRYP